MQCRQIEVDREEEKRIQERKGKTEEKKMTSSKGSSIGKRNRPGCKKEGGRQESGFSIKRARPSQKRGATRKKVAIAVLGGKPCSRRIKRASILCKGA